MGVVFEIPRAKNNNRDISGSRDHFFKDMSNFSHVRSQKLLMCLAAPQKVVSVKKLFIVKYNGIRNRWC